MTRSRAAGVVLRKAFRELPVPAALLDARGRVAEVNPAWQTLPTVSDSIGKGASFEEAWRTITGDRLLDGAVTTVLETGTPVKAEATVPGAEPLRVLAEIGPVTPAGQETGALVILIDLTKQYGREQALFYAATHDPLTGVANRVAVEHAVEEALDRLRRYGEPFALLYVDLDSFKPINDRFGHPIGDAVLRALADRWRGVVRAPDVLGRVGGDEFVVVLQHTAGRDEVGAVADRLLESLSEPFAVGSRKVVLSASIGMVFPPSDMTAGNALALADRAMYREKARRTGYPLGDRGGSDEFLAKRALPAVPRLRASVSSLLSVVGTEDAVRCVAGGFLNGTTGVLAATTDGLLFISRDRSHFDVPYGDVVAFRAQRGLVAASLEVRDAHGRYLVKQVHPRDRLSTFAALLGAHAPRP